MPKPGLRSRSSKHHQIKLPGGRVKRRYKRYGSNSFKCYRCGGDLPGVSHKIPLKNRKLPKNQRRPERIYGGKLCSNCLRTSLILATRSL